MQLDTTPAWLTPAPKFAKAPPLARHATADVVVVGAGIAGVTSAYLLASEGKSVVLLDDSPPTQSETAHTSAHLASAIDDRFYELESIHGADKARLARASHAAAINRIEALVAELGIGCDFRRVPGRLYLNGEDGPEVLARELEAAKRAGIGVRKVAGKGRAIPDGMHLAFAGQARFDPMKYVAGVLRAAIRAGVRFHAGSQVIDVQGGGMVTATTHTGHAVRAGAAIVASNVPAPINDWMGLYLKQVPHRTYVVSLEIDPATVEDALYWDTEDARGAYHYVRLDPSRRLLLAGGEDHKVGQAPEGGTTRPFEVLEAWARERFPQAGARRHLWSGQVNEPVDGLAYLGLAPTKGGNVYCITGDSGMGLTHGTLGAMICCDLIRGRKNRYAGLYDPARKPKGNLADLAAENLNAAARYLDFLTPGEVHDEKEIPRGSGAIVRQGLKKVAVYVADDGRVTRCSAACTHLACLVRWNEAEGSWDCPCHGSRFSPTGEVLMGPAVEPLKRV